MGDDRRKIIEEVARLEQLQKRIVEGAQRGGRSRSAAKVAAGRDNAAHARTMKEMYRKFPVLRDRTRTKEE